MCSWLLQACRHQQAVCLLLQCPLVLQHCLLVLQHCLLVLQHCLLVVQHCLLVLQHRLLVAWWKSVGKLCSEALHGSSPLRSIPVVGYSASFRANSRNSRNDPK